MGGIDVSETFLVLIGGQLKINMFSFQTFRHSLQKQLIINVNKYV